MLHNKTENGNMEYVKINKPNFKSTEAWKKKNQLSKMNKKISNWNITTNDSEIIEINFNELFSKSLSYNFENMVIDINGTHENKESVLINDKFDDVDFISEEEDLDNDWIDDGEDDSDYCVLDMIDEDLTNENYNDTDEETVIDYLDEEDYLEFEDYEEEDDDITNIEDANMCINFFLGPNSVKHLPHETSRSSNQERISQYYSYNMESDLESEEESYLDNLYEAEEEEKQTEYEIGESDSINHTYNEKTLQM